MEWNLEWTEATAQAEMGETLTATRCNARRSHNSTFDIKPLRTRLFVREVEHDRPSHGGVVLDKDRSPRR